MKINTLETPGTSCSLNIAQMVEKVSLQIVTYLHRYPCTVQNLLVGCEQLISKAKNSSVTTLCNFSYPAECASGAVNGN